MNTTTIPSMMRAAVLESPRKIGIERVPVPQPGPDEVLVEVDANSLCCSDVHFYMGDRSLPGPMILGHEIAGHLVATGSNVSPERLGERVSVEPNFGCGECNLCARGLERLCPRKQTIGITRWGGLAEYVVVPTEYAWAVPETFSLADAATIEPTAVVVHAFNRAQVKPAETIAVFGAGGVGLLLITLAVANGNQVVALELNLARREAALAAGAVAAVAAPPDAQETEALFEHYGVTTIFECVGLAATTQLCLNAAPPGSLIVLVGLSTENVALNPLRFARRELDLRGALIYEHPKDFAATIDLVTAGKLKPGVTTSQPQPLEKVGEILETMAAGKVNAKPVISPHL